MTRRQQAIVALHDFGSREGATADSLKAAMLKAGFSLKEMAQAAADMLGQ